MPARDAMNCSAPWRFCNGSMSLTECGLDRCTGYGIALYGQCYDACDEHQACLTCPGPSVYADLHGTIPDSWCYISGLHSFFLLQMNRVTGPLPNCMGYSTPGSYLTSFALRSVPGLTGTLPASLGSLPMRGQFSLMDLLLTGSIPSSLGSAFSDITFASSQLTAMTFSLSSMPMVTGTLPSSLGSLVAVNRVFAVADMPNIQGTIPSSLGKLTNLVRDFGLVNMPLVTGTIPSDLGQLSKLGDTDIATTQQLAFRLSNLQLTGTIPPALSSINQVTSFRLDDNRLTGAVHLPCVKTADYFESAKYSLVNLSHNRLTNIPIAPQYTSIVESDFCLSPLHMRALHISGNQLDGTIPAAMGSLTQLQSLSLSNCGYYGTLPSSLGHLSALQTFIADDNRLTGPLSNAASMPLLTAISLKNNGLSGTVPGDLPFATMTLLDLSCNNFYNTLPTQMCGLGISTQLTFCNLTQAVEDGPWDCSSLNRTCATSIKALCHGVGSHCIDTSQIFTVEQLVFIGLGAVLFIALVLAAITVLLRWRRQRRLLSLKQKQLRGTIQMLQRCLPEENIQDVMLPVGCVNFANNSPCIASGGGGTVYRCMLTLSATSKTSLRTTVALKEIHSMRDEVNVVDGLLFRSHHTSLLIVPWSFRRLTGDVHHSILCVMQALLNL